MASFLACIGPLVFIHEFGHYWVARWFGVRAEIFSIGFGRAIAAWTDRRGTRWKIGWLPLGGYVRFTGDMNAASQPNPQWLALPADERARTFQAKPVWQRALIVAAGPAANFLFAILLLAAIFGTIGYPESAPVVKSLVKESPAATAGFKTGDRIVAIDGNEMNDFMDVYTYVRQHPGQNLLFTLQRNGRIIRIEATPAIQIQRDEYGHTSKIGTLGILSQVVVTKPPPGQLIAKAVATAGEITHSMAIALGEVVTGSRSVQDLGGPLKIAEISGQQASLGWLPFLWLMAMISINLGFINLLPIPVLDGGHLFFYLIESVRRKPLKPQTVAKALRAGLAVLLALMIFVTFNDLASIGIWNRLGGLIG